MQDYRRRKSTPPPYGGGVGLWYHRSMGIKGMGRWFDEISRWGILLLCGLLPFFFIPVSWITVAQSKMALAAILLAIIALSWALARLAEGHLRIPASFVLASGILVPLAYAISAGVAGFPSLSLVGSGVEQDTLAAACLWYGALLLPALLFSDSGGRFLLAVRALFLGAFVLVLLQIIHLTVPSLPLSSVFAASTGNALGSWHDFGIALGFFLLLGYVFMDAGTRFDRYLFGATAVFSFLLLIVADFFDVWVGVGVVSLLLLFHRVWGMHIERPWTFLRSLHTDWRVYAPLLLLILSAGIFSVFGTSIATKLPKQIQVASFEVRPSWAGTLQIGQAALTNPSKLFFGVGPNTFTRQWGLYKPVGVNQTPFWNVDFSAGYGSIPTSFITLGILGLLAWVLFIACVLWRAGMTYVQTPHRGVQRERAAGLALCALYLMVFHVLYIPGTALEILAFLSIGLLTAYLVHLGLVRSYAFNLYETGWKGATSLGVAGLAMLFVIFAGGSITRVIAAETLVNRSIITYNATQDIARSSALVGKALRIYPSDDRAHRAGVELGLLQLQQLISKGDATSTVARSELQSTLQATIQHGLDAVSINGSDYQNWLELASLYQNLGGAQVAGAYDNARAAYQKAIEENPTSPFPLFQLARLELLENHTDLALQDLVAAVKLKPDYAAAYYLASQIYAAQGDFKSAIPVAAQAVNSAPDDPAAWYNLGIIAYAGGDFANAATAEEQALARNPQYANALYVLGLSYYELKRPADALKAFEALAALDPSASIVVTIIENLKAGKAPLPAQGGK